MDDELIGYIYKFMNTIIIQMETNITGVNDIFKLMQETDINDLDIINSDSPLK
jgi:hypothetical protein